MFTRAGWGEERLDSGARTSGGPYLVEKVAFMSGWTPSLHWPDRSTVERSRRRAGATGSEMVPRGRRRQRCRGTESLRAAVTERSANPTHPTPTTPPEFEA